MSVDEKLYDLLAGDREIPWGYAAGQFLMVKVASGGLYPDDAEEVCKVVLAASEVSDQQEKTRQAYEQGLLGGLRSVAFGDVSHVGRVRRNRGERLGGTLGMGGGAGLGLLLTRGKTPGEKAIGSALGLIGGRAIGKNIGTEIDAARIRSRLSPKKKEAEIEKKSAASDKKDDQGMFSPVQKSMLMGAGMGALTGLGYGGLVAPILARRSIGKNYDFVKAMGEGKADISGIGALDRARAIIQAEKFNRDIASAKSTLGLSDSAARKHVLSQEAEAYLQKQHRGIGPLGRTVSGGIAGAALGALAGGLVYNEMQRLKARKKEKTAAVNRVYHLLTKTAQNPSGDPTITSPVVPMPAESPLLAPGGPQPLHPAIEAQLQQMQQQNEAEFYRQQAEEAKQEADQGRQRVEELIQQLNMLNQQSQQQMMQDQQVRQMSEQQAQMASQDATVARNESLQAQQQNMQLRTAVTQFRQALMNLVAQDPTMMMGPPQVQTGPMPPQPGAEQAPQAAPEAAAQMGAPAAGAPEAAGQVPAQAPEAAPAVPPQPMTAPQAPEMMTPPPPAGGAPAAPAAM